MKQEKNDVWFKDMAIRVSNETKIYLTNINIPLELKKEISSWDIAIKSQYSDSFYNNVYKSWNYTLDGTLRVANHWNFLKKGRVHCKTNINILDNKYWALGKYSTETDEYEILKIYKDTGYSIDENILKYYRMYCNPLNVYKHTCLEKEINLRFVTEKTNTLLKTHIPFDDFTIEMVRPGFYILSKNSKSFIIGKYIETFEVGNKEKVTLVKYIDEYTQRERVIPYEKIFRIYIPTIMKSFDNEKRTRYYGLRVGDIVSPNVFHGPKLPDAEVVKYGFMDNNRVYIKFPDGKETDWVAEHCTIVTKVEDRTDYKK